MYCFAEGLLILSTNKTVMGGIRLSSSSPRRIWFKYGDGQPVSLVFDGDDVYDLKKAIKKELSNQLGAVDVSKMNLRKHGEEEDLRANLTVDENFVNSFDTPLQLIVNASGMYSSLLESRGSDNSTKIIFT